MIALLFALFSTPAQASSIDNLDIGGMWGTPNNTGPTALWWNPAAMADGSGTHFTIEGAPILAHVTVDRDHAVWGGEDKYSYFGVAPFLGVTTDFGVDGLGIGVAMFVPYAASLNHKEGPNASSYQLIDGGIQAIQFQLGASYQFADIFSVGAGVGLLYSEYRALLDVQAATGLADGIGDLFALSEDDVAYYDSVIEDPDYATRTTFGPLRGLGVTFNAGVHVRPMEMLGISAAYNHGATVHHTGPVGLDFGCPPEDDGLGFLGASLFGLCNAEVAADGSIRYTYPSRITGGFQLTPVPTVKLELMGGYVFWEQYTDFFIDIDNPVKTGGDDTELSEDAKVLLSEDKRWARANENSVFVALDAKFQARDWLLIGGRVLFDQQAVPDRALSANNFDANRLQLGLLVAVKPAKWIEIGASYNQSILFSRTVTNSAYRVNVAEEDRVEGRYFYPETNGTYSANIARFGLSVRGHFLEKKKERGGEAAVAPERATVAPEAAVEPEPENTPTEAKRKAEVEDEPASGDVSEAPVEGDAPANGAAPADGEALDAPTAVDAPLDVEALEAPVDESGDEAPEE